MVISVCTVTYNHAKFIAETLEGVLMQQTKFNVELIICNDSSTDNTSTIIGEFSKKEYIKKNIRVFHHQKNLGMKSNFIFALKQCTGKYIALCDGDDYWTDPNKLQKQIDELEKNKNCIISFHNVAIVNGCEKEMGLVYNQPAGNLVFEDLLAGKFIKTPSMVFRNILDEDIADFIVDDTTLGLYLLRNGGFAYYMDETMAAYRIHEGGIWSKKNSYERYLLCETAIQFIKRKYTDKSPLLTGKMLYNHYYEHLQYLFRERFYRHGFFLVSQLFRYKLLKFVRVKHIYHTLRTLVRSVLK